MSTSTQTRDWTSADAGAEIVRYRADSGIAVLELNDPPANTYTLRDDARSSTTRS